MRDQHNVGRKTETLQVLDDAAGVGLDVVATATPPLSCDRVA
jgi:hypothetical protein